MSAILRPRFYLVISWALVAFVVVGFSRSYYLRILSDPPPLTTLLHLHAAVFTVWLALFLAQAGLVAVHRVDLHRKLGIASAIFAGFALGIIYRRRPALHRRFMTLGFIASISPATARLLRLLDVQEHRDVLIPLCAALFIGACLVYDWRKHRVVHPVYVIGGLVIIASWPLRKMIGHSEWYFPIGESVARLARAMFG
jgi:hypothetical protein